MKIFVTGIRGGLGSEVAARLIKDGHSIVGLLHSDDPILCNDNSPLATTPCDGSYPEAGHIATVKGDIRKEKFNLDAETYQRLQQSTDMIVHSAALTRFGRPRERYQQINVIGTKVVLDFALKNDKQPIPLVHISTMYVCGERPGIFKEGDLKRNQSFGNPYEESKYQAEIHVRHAMKHNNLPVVIARPAIIVGHSVTGVLRRFDTLYSVYRLTAAGLVRTIPGDYGSALDIVPIDWVADSIVDAVTKFDIAKGQTLHLSSDKAVTLRDINDVSAEYPSFNVPRFVPSHVFHAYDMKGLEKRYYDEVVVLYESYFQRQVHFVRDSTNAIIRNPPRASGKELLRVIFDYAISVGYFKRQNNEI